jgi:hypothetical protein
VLRPLLETYEAMLAAATGAGRYTGDAQRGPLRTLQAGIDQTKSAIGTWERVAGETSP